jgi:D-glycero-D-manno-heptose 1,7-bisphosphate phosphatase
MKAVFLDRDGTVIRDPEDERVDRLDKIELFSDSIEALKLLATLDYGVILITNQAGIAEGRINEAEFEVINGKVIELLEQSGVKILKTYMCPHVAADNCDCRKPKPKMILDAAKDFDVDMAQSWMIGDHQSDITAGLNAGTKTILLQTANKPEMSADATYTAPTLLNAIEYISKQ